VEIMSGASQLAADLALALRAVEAAGSAVLPFFRSDTPVEYKSPDQPVTEADLLANRILQDVLCGERPTYGWLSEETADSADRLGRERVWIVDPLDGTRSFIDGFPEYAISVGLVERGDARIGVVLNPSTRELYHAVQGGGAYLNDRPIGIAPQDRPGCTLVASRSELRRGEFDALPETWQLLPLGGTAYKMVKVADGTATAYLSRGPKSEWDVCAAGLIVSEAGGRVVDLAGSPLRFNRPAPFLQGIVVANAAAHTEVLRDLAMLPRVERGWTESIT
jgi:myo-inositol-1(or 4)-monophosphatase